MAKGASPEAPSPADAADGTPPPHVSSAAETAGDTGAPRSTPQPSRRISRLVSVSEDSELAHMEAGGGSGAAKDGDTSGGAAGGSPPAQLPAAGSVSAFGSASLSLMAPRRNNGEDGERGRGAPPSPGSRAAAAAGKLQQRMRRVWAEAAQIWWGLPSACKLAMVLAVINFCISCAYAIVGLMLPNVDEEIHISITIIVSSVFVMFSVVDAVIYENTLELVAAIVLDMLVLARMVWFASRGSANASFKWTWVSIMCAFQVLFMITAVLAWRQFGWRLYGKLGVDFREKGAASRMRKALQRNAYVTVLKINVMFLCVLTAIGVDVSVEKRDNVQASIMAISLIGLFVGCFATWTAAKLTLKQRVLSKWMLLGFHCLMVLALAQPIAVLAIYNTDHESRANATVSLNVGGGVYIFTSLVCWLATIRLIRRNERALSRGSAASMGATSGAATGDPRLAPMQAGAWLGKPTQRNPRKIRFFQLSHDGSTLRWGWNKFVRLYYVDDLICDDEELTISLAFPFEAELVLKFPDAATYQAWRRGFAHLLLCLMAPDAPAPAEAAGLPAGQGQQGGGKAAAGWGVVGRTTSRGLMRSLADGSEAPDSVPGRRNTSAAFIALQKLGVRVQELGRRVAPRQRPSQTSSLGERASRRATGDSDWPGLPSSDGASGSQRGQPETPRAVAEQRAERAEAAAEHDAAQQAKRQRMVAYLQSVAQQHPTGVPPVVLRRKATPSPSSGAPQPAPPLRRRRRLSSEAGGHVRVMVSVAVQTEESALQQLAYQSVRAAAPSTPPHAASATAAPLSVPRAGSEGGDAELAAQYAAAMAAAGGGPGLPAQHAQPAAQPQHAQQAQQRAQQQQQIEGGGDADIASQWMAAMMAAGGAGGAAAAGAFGSPQPGQPGLPAAAGSGSSGGDEDIAAQYLAAMQSAMGPAGASPPAAQQQQQQQQQAEQAAEQRGRPQRPPQYSPPTPGSEQPTPAHSQRSIAHYSLPASASPLEQLAWQQQQRSLQQMQHASPASAGTSAVWHGGGTPGWGTPQRSQSLALGAGLWQLAAAVDVIDFEELSFGKLLGAGAEGAVYAAWFLESPVAVKKFNRVEDSLHEVQMYLLLGSHDNIVALRGLCQHEGSMYLVLEYCPRGTLDVLLHHTARNPWDPQKLLPLIRSIARGMHYLHSRNILHRDLKPANIFVGHGQMMKIGDFGMARIVDEAGPPALRRLTPGVVGTLQYSAPELLNEDLRPQGTEDAEWALKLDVWSFGVTVWEILERRRPFEGLSQHAVQAQWMADPYSACLPPVRLPEHLDKAGKRIYRGLADLVEDCTRLDPFARPSFRDVLLRLKSLAGFAERQDMPPF